MPMAAAQGSLGYGRFGYTTLPSGTGWITAGDGTLTYDLESPFAIAIDSAGNVLVPGTNEEQTGGGAQVSALLYKLTNEGIAVYTQYIQNSTTTPARTCTFNSCAVDSSNNVYAVGKAFSGTTQSDAPLLAKYDSSGTLQWQRMFEVSSMNSVDSGIDVDVDSDGNSYIISSTFEAPSNVTYVTKYNTSGTLQWSRSIGTFSTTSKLIISNVVDSSGNLYVAFYDYTNTQIFKFNSSGTTLWKKQIAGISASTSCALSTDGTNICYAYSLGYIIIDSSGEIVRQNKIDSSYSITVFGGALGSDGKVYLLGRIGTGGTGTARYRTILIGFDSDDSLLYCNQMALSTQQFNPKGIAVRDNSLYVTCQTGTDYTSWSFKVAANGYIPGKGSYSLTLNSTTYTCLYTAVGMATVGSSYTIATSTYPVATATLTNYNSSFTNGTRSWTWGHVIL